MDLDKAFKAFFKGTSKYPNYKKKTNRQSFRIPQFFNFTDNFTVKSKRSQSALEYMMTYGWAILIIVIVAVILYSMGIFNPSSSVSSTVIGFSGLGSV